MNIIRHLAAQVQANPTCIAIQDKAGEITFYELWIQVQELAKFYQSKGLRRGDRVLVFVPMSIDLYRSVLAILYLGAVAVFLDQWSGYKRLRQSMRVANCHAAVLTRKMRILSYAFPEAWRLKVRLPPSIPCSGRDKIQEWEWARVDSSDSALITFTTGSTGTPKAADRSHGLLDAQLAALLPLLRPDQTRIDLTMLPIVLLLNLAIGRRSIIGDINYRKPAQFKRTEILENFLQKGGTSLTGSPFYCTQLALAAQESAVEGCAQVTAVTLGGSPVFAHDVEILAAGFPVAELNIVYGSTEAEPISHITAQELLLELSRSSKTYYQYDNGLPVGAPSPEARVAILPYRDSAWPQLDAVGFGESCMPEESIGEIVVNGNHVLERYFNNPEALRANKIFVDDQVWHRTGDAGCIRTGRLYLYGRCAQRIVRQEKTFYPFIVAAQLQQLQGVKQATLIELNEHLILAYAGTADARAAVEEWTLAQGLTQVQVQRFDQLPLDPRHHGKLDYDKLEQVVRQRLNI